MAYKVLSFLLMWVVFASADDVSAQANEQSMPEIEITENFTDSALVYTFLDEASKARRGGNISHQRNLLKRAWEVADSLESGILLKRVEVDLGEYYLETSSYDSAETVLEQAVERSSNKRLQTKVLNNLATAYLYQSQYPQAMSTYNEGLSLIDSLEAPNIYMAISTNKAGIYEKSGNLSEAISIYQKGITFAEAIADTSFLATALNNLGKLYYEQENFEDALPYLEEAISVSEDSGLYTTLLRATHNLASTYRDIGNYEKSRELFEEAWALHEKVRPDNPPIQLLFNMGMYHLQVSEHAEAEQHFKESLDYSRQAGIPEGIFHNNIGLGDVALQRRDYLAATNFYDRAFDVAQKIDSPPFRIAASQNLYEAYKESGNYEKALSYHEVAKQVSDSLTEVQQDEQLALAETELGLRQQQKMNRLLQDRQEQQEARISAQNWVIGLSGLIIAIILGSAVMLYRSNKERQRVNKELKELNEVKDKMMAVIAHDLRSPLTSMQGIFYLLKDEALSMDEIKELAAELEVSTRQNIAMMDNLLSWTNSQMSGLEVDIQQVSAFDIVQEVVENSKLQANHKSINLVNKVDEDIQVAADPNLLKLIIRNLINNAIKFSNEGDAVFIDAEMQNGNVVLKIKDTGIGIPQEEQGHLFSTVGKSRSGTRNEKGSGLGLQLCKEFAEKQNGGIRLESTKGAGTTFYINLPKGDN